MNTKRLIFKIALRYLPKNKFFDKILCFIQFTIIHKRFPTSRKLFNDMIHQIKTSDKIEDPLVVFTSDKEYCKIFLNYNVEKKYIVPTWLLQTLFQKLKTIKSQATV